MQRSSFSSDANPELTPEIERSDVLGEVQEPEKKVNSECVSEDKDGDLPKESESQLGIEQKEKLVVLMPQQAQVAL